MKKGKVNQDTPIIYPKQLAELSVAHFAVCDGHGKFGEFDFYVDHFLGLK